ncbi:MAG: hypothetical protein H6Q92_1274, partial [Nitrospirae bacterium]|nr:hypothetical protein [Nitrospirota bacterium]
MNLLSILMLAVLWVFPVSAYALADNAMPLNELSVQIDPRDSSIKGVSRISLPAGQSAKINLTGIEVTAVSVGDRALAVGPGTE